MYRHAHTHVYIHTHTHIFRFGNSYVPRARYFLISRDRWHARSRYFFEIVARARGTCCRALSRTHHKYLNSGSKKNYVFTSRRRNSGGTPDCVLFAAMFRERYDFPERFRDVTHRRFVESVEKEQSSVESREH